MSSAPVIGIDLGTTNSVVAVAGSGRVEPVRDEEGRALVPSVVSFHPSGEVLVGVPARERRLLDARNTVYSVKRLLGRPFSSPQVQRAKERFPFQLVEGPSGSVLVEARGERYALSEVSAFLLRELRAFASRRLGVEVRRAVVTVPANFNELQRSATKAAARVAGLDVLRILNEPTAAALAYGYGRGGRERIAVFDLGGGTFDVTILELAGKVFEVVATAGDTYLGGDDVDALVAERMAEAFLQHHRYDPRSDDQAIERLRVAAEWAKCQLSERAEVHVRVEELAFGPEGLPLDLEFRITRAELERMAQPLLARTFDVCEDAMRVAGVRPTQLDNVVLVGGATRMPLVRRMVADYFGREPLSHLDPDLVVAYGAAIQARALAGDVRPASTRRAGKALGRITLRRVPAAPPPVPPSPHRAAAVPPPVPGPAASPPAAAPSEAAALPVSSDDRWSESPPPPPVAGPPPLPAATTKASVAAILGSTASEDALVDADDVQLVEVRPTSGPGGGGPEPPMLHAADGVELADPDVPLLLDVTPLTLGIETVDGYCEAVIPRNAAIPASETKVFSTAADGQTEVRVQISQGESRRLEENQLLGEVELTGLPPAARGKVQVEVTFVIGADGTLDVRARDRVTGQHRSVRVDLLGGLSDEEEIARMRERHERLRVRGEEP